MKGLLLIAGLLISSFAHAQVTPYQPANTVMGCGATACAPSGLTALPSVDSSSATATASGGNTAITNAARFAWSVNVKDFGAKCDGVTDDATVINAAISYVRNVLQPSYIGQARLVFPQGKCVVKSSLNFTNLAMNYPMPISIEGWGTTIYGAIAGAPIIDALGSRSLSWHGMQIMGDATTVPNIGIQIGRLSDVQSGGSNMFFDDVYIGGDYTFAAFYNFGGEVLTMLNVGMANSYVSPTPTISGVAISGTAGQFTCTCANFSVGDTLTISGTYGGTGSITGYTNPTKYYMSSVTGPVGAQTGFTLTTQGGAALTTTTGTPTGLTYTPNDYLTYTLVQDGIYHFGVTSAFASETATPNTPVSFNDDVFIATYVYEGGGGIPIWMAGTRRMKFVEGLCTTISAVYCVAMYSFAGTDGNILFDADMHTETTTTASIFLITGGNATPTITSMRYNDEGGQESTSIFQQDTGITSTTFNNLNIQAGTFQSGSVTVFDTAANYNVSAGLISVPALTNFPAPPATFSGNLCIANVCDDYKNPGGSYTNTSAGHGSTTAAVTGVSDTAFGSTALAALTSGNNNTAVGAAALAADQTNSQGTAVGANALSTSAAQANTAVGYQAGQYIGTGATNTAIGQGAMAGVTGSHTTGSSNTAVGAVALTALQGSTPNYNTGIGEAAGQTITTGTNNTILGQAVLSATITTGSNNTAIGNSASCTPSGVAAATSNTLSICAGAGPLIGATGGGTPNTALITNYSPTIVGATTATATVSASTCATIGTYAGNGTAGSFKITTGGAACIFTVTLNGATGLTAPTGWVANADDVTNGVHCVNSATVSQTTVVFTCTAVSGDVLKWSAVPY